MKLFHPVGTIDWQRVFLTVTAGTAFWTAVSSIIPKEYHRIGESLLTGLTGFALVMVRGNKWAKREETLTEKQEEKR